MRYKFLQVPLDVDVLLSVLQKEDTLRSATKARQMIMRNFTLFYVRHKYVQVPLDVDVC